MAIVVLGAGRQSIAPEYGQSTLTAASLLRLHYAIWLSRRTGAPILFSGGIGHGQTDGPSEAEIAARIAERDYQRPLRWIETGSRDTRENAVRSVSMLERENLSEIILVTHGWHMRRSLKVFQWSVDRQGGAINLTPAPMDLGRRDISPVLRWIPSSEGISLGRSVWREAIGLWVGA